MDWIALTVLAVALAMDAFAVSLAAGVLLAPVTARHCFRLGFHFGLFQGLMPVLGWLAGMGLRAHILAWDHWVAFVLLTGLGLRMIHEARQEEETLVGDPSRGVRLVLLSIATSIDALAVGVSLAMIHVDIWVPALVIALVAGIFSVSGVLLGARIGGRWGRRVGILGGLLLLGIGIRILVEHLGA